MKKLLGILILLCLHLNMYAGGGNNQIKSYNELMAVLTSGKSVSVVIHYGKCKEIRDNEEVPKPPAAIGGMTIDTYEFFDTLAVKNKNAFVAFSESKLIEDPKSDDYIYNYVKIKVNDDNTVRVIARYLDAKTFEVKMDESFYTSINDGTNNGAIYFYSNE